MFRAVLLIFALALLTACGGKSKNAGPPVRNTLDDVAPAVADAPYARVLKRCATAVTVATSCSLDTLPVLGMETPAPSVDDIMGRVLVSHPWMAGRFRALLAALPEDIHLLMRGVTAVVIDADIRPSYYWALTGAIYLDPEYLWLMPEERAVISKAPDYRSEFAEPMAYRSMWRYVVDGQSIFASSGSKSARTLSDIKPPMAALLFHELAHANDALSPASYLDGHIDTRQKFEEAVRSVAEGAPSLKLVGFQRLYSREMERLAAILYTGQPPTAGEKTITAVEVGGFFEPDGANDDYAYTSRHEDLAMLFEEAMMKIHLNIDRDTAFTTVPAAGAGGCNQYRVGWGERNRVGADWITPRALWVTEQLLPERDYSAEFAELPAPQALPLNAGWCESISLNEPMSKAQFYSPSAMDAEPPFRPTPRPYRLKQ